MLKLRSRPGGSFLKRQQKLMRRFQISSALTFKANFRHMNPGIATVAVNVTNTAARLDSDFITILFPFFSD